MQSRNKEKLVGEWEMKGVLELKPNGVQGSRWRAFYWCVLIGCCGQARRARMEQAETDTRLPGQLVHQAGVVVNGGAVPQ